VTRGLRVCYSVCYCFVLLQSDGRNFRRGRRGVKGVTQDAFRKKKRHVGGEGVRRDAFAGSSSTVQYITACVWGQCIGEEKL
jgi:hypothetical protein